MAAQLRMVAAVGPRVDARGLALQLSDATTRELALSPPSTETLASQRRGVFANILEMAASLKHEGH